MTPRPLHSAPPPSACSKETSPMVTHESVFISKPRLSGSAVLKSMSDLRETHSVQQKLRAAHFPRTPVVRCPRALWQQLGVCVMCAET